MSSRTTTDGAGDGSSTSSSPWAAGQRPPRIAIIGGGIAGIATLRALHALRGGTDADNDDVVLYERQSGPGGLWRCNYPGCGVQSSPELYEFPDKRYPPWIRHRRDPPGPTASEVCIYVEEYIKERGLDTYMRFDVEVLGVSRVAASASAAAEDGGGEGNDDAASTRMRDAEGRWRHRWIVRTRQLPRPTQTRGGRRGNNRGGAGERSPRNGAAASSPTTTTEEVDDAEPTIREDVFDYVIVCTGLVSSKPHVPDLPGSDAFAESGGVILHTSKWNSWDTVSNDRRVVVVGNGKSAVDAAFAASTCCGPDDPVVQVVRETHWYFPRYVANLFHYKYVFHSRLGSTLLPRYRANSSLPYRVGHALAHTIKWIMWRFLEVLFLLTYRIPVAQWPKFGTMERDALGASGLVTDELSHLRACRRGAIDCRVGCTVRELRGGGRGGEGRRARRPRVVLDPSGEEVEADVLLLGTGWEMGLDVLDEGVRGRLDLEADGLWLYRNVLPANDSELGGLAFVGSNALTFINPLTHVIQAAWLARLIADGGLVGGPERGWPSEELMRRDVEDDKRYKRRVYPYCRQRGAMIEGHMQHYQDQLMREMGLDPMRYGGPWGPFANWVLPVEPSLLEGVLFCSDLGRGGGGGGSGGVYGKVPTPRWFDYTCWTVVTVLLVLLVPEVFLALDID